MTNPQPETRWRTIRSAVRNHAALWVTITLGFTLFYYLMLMAALVIKFGALPNYWANHNWPANVVKIIQSTPSVGDMLPIIADEWLFEIGYMNYDYGHGISEWALDILPAKAAVALLLGVLIATFCVLQFERKACGARLQAGSSALGGFGAACVAFTSATMSWVVCCSTPTWVVGLSMLGLGVTTSLWLEPLGLWISLSGFAVMAAAIFGASGSGNGRWKPESSPSPFNKPGKQEYQL